MIKLVSQLDLLGSEAKEYGSNFSSTLQGRLKRAGREGLLKIYIGLKTFDIDFSEDISLIKD